MTSKRLLDLNIDVIEPTQHHKHPDVYHKVLPQHEFSMLIVAPKGSGKTNLLCNLILKHYKQYFHRIIVCSPTVDNDDKWDVVQSERNVLKENKKLEKALDGFTHKNKKIKKVVFNGKEPLEEQLKKAETRFDGIIPKEDFITDLDEIPRKIKEQQDIIKQLHDKGYKKQAKYIADRMLVVLDDQAGMFKGGNVNNPMVNYVIKHRHSSSSVIIVTQAYKAIPKTIRTNCNALILFEIPNLSELKVIYEENPEGLNEHEWMKVYQHATEEPYSFMYINNKFPKGQRIYKRFDSQLVVEKSKKQLKFPKDKPKDKEELDDGNDKVKENNE